MVFHVDIKKACKRKYLANGDEIEPDLGSKQKVNTGYLMSSYSKYHALTCDEILCFNDKKNAIPLNLKDKPDFLQVGCCELFMFSIM